MKFSNKRDRDVQVSRAGTECRVDRDPDRDSRHRMPGPRPRKGTSGTAEAPGHDDSNRESPAVVPSAGAGARVHVRALRLHCQWRLGWFRADGRLHPHSEGGGCASLEKGRAAVHRRRGTARRRKAWCFQSWRVTPTVCPQAGTRDVPAHSDSGKRLAEIKLFEKKLKVLILEDICGAAQIIEAQRYQPTTGTLFNFWFLTFHQTT